ncbi:MAG: hypothetical protein GXP18_02390 [Gammaproteobacteria bacterium]|nr:hypothetical protein [Gammaproteobacteria bacterium]
MNNLAQIDPNILFKRIKNQFLAAIIGIIILVIFCIPYIISLGVSDNNKYIAVIALVIISILAAFMVIKLNRETQELQKLDEQNKKSTTNTSHKVWRLIVGLGEACLESDVPNNKRIFVSNALSQVIESEIENLTDDEVMLKTILLEIKSASDSEIKQKRTFSEVLMKQNNTQI